VSVHGLIVSGEYWKNSIPLKRVIVKKNRIGRGQVLGIRGMESGWGCFRKRFRCDRGHRRNRLVTDDVESIEGDKTEFRGKTQAYVGRLSVRSSLFGRRKPYALKDSSLFWQQSKRRNMVTLGGEAGVLKEIG